MSCQYFFSTKGFCWIFLSFVYVNLGIFCAFNNAAFEHMLAQTTTPAQNPLTSVALGQIRLRPQIVASPPPPHLPPPRIALFLLPPSVPLEAKRLLFCCLWRWRWVQKTLIGYSSPLPPPSSFLCKNGGGNNLPPLGPRGKSWAKKSLNYVVFLP